MGSKDINENVNECIVHLYKGGGSGGVQGPGWRCIKYKWKWKFEMESEINQVTKVTGAALVVMTMTKAATLITLSLFLPGPKTFPAYVDDFRFYFFIGSGYYRKTFYRKWLL